MSAAKHPGRRALVVDDEQALARLVAGYLEREGFEVDVEFDGPSAVRTTREHDPEVIVLDLGLPGLDGVEVCRQVRTFSDAYVVMLTARAEEVDTLIGLSVGADDYMTKPFRPRELVARVAALMRRPRATRDDSSLPPPPATDLTFGELRIDPPGREVWLSGQEVALTRTEFDLLAALAAAPQRVFSRRALIAAVWGHDWVGDEHLGTTTRSNHMTRRHARTARLIVLAAAGGLVMAACSNTNGANDAPASAPPAASSSATANSADVEFAQMMIVHHQGALDMAALAADRAASPEVKKLAAQIEAAQQPEIDTMTGWLKAWGEETLDAGGAMPGMDHGDMSMDGQGGMASQDDMERLTNATGTDFDQLFLTLMIAHHQGAIEMAQTQVDNGQDPDAVALAQKVITDQSAEIEQMKTLLAPYAGN